MQNKSLIPLFPNKGEINSLAQLRELVGTKFTNSIIIQSKLGDPDWLFDIISELGKLKPGDKFYLADFHGPIQKRGYLPFQFDCHAISKEIDEFTLTPEQQARLDKLRNEL